MIKFLITFAIIGLFFWILFATKWIWAVNQARRKGLFPSKDKATLFDVRNLLVHNERELAVILYCQIYSVGKKEGQAAVLELENSLRSEDINSD